MTDERFNLEDELGAYLLGALSPEETRRVEEVLETSESARERLLYMQPAVELLGEAVPRREPPPQLRARILADVGVDEPALAPRAAKRSGRSWFSFGNFSLQPAMALAGVLLVAAVGVVGYEVGTGGNSDAPPTYVNKNARLEVDSSGNGGTLQLTGLASPAPNQDFQAWVQEGDTMVPSSLFAVRKDGTASAAIPNGLDGAKAVVVTAEPKGGSQTPTGPIVASVALPD